MFIQLLYNGYWVSFSGVKWRSRGVDQPSPSNGDIQERVELYYTPLWAFVDCVRVIFAIFPLCSVNSLTHNIFNTIFPLRSVHSLTNNIFNTIFPLRSVYSLTHNIFKTIFPLRSVHSLTHNIFKTIFPLCSVHSLTHNIFNTIFLYVLSIP
jgi:hypothetical protein